ncbi:MAG: GntR family transcriptional regulator [Alphaproteobacteria bacterium]
MSTMAVASTMRERVYRRLREEILTCRLAPGLELHEADLAGSFATSKTPVRDALMRLASDGLIDVMPRRGYRVAAMTGRAVREAFELREVLEHGCVATAINSASDRTLAALEAWREFDAEAGVAAFLEYNHDFHIALARLSPNSQLANLAIEALEKCERLPWLSTETYDLETRRRLVAEHGEIIDAIRTREPAAVTSALSRHHDDCRLKAIDALHHWREWSEC